MVSNPQSRYLCFLNSDTEPQAGWVQPLVDGVEKHASVGLVGPKLLFPDGTIQSAGGLFDAGRGPYHRHLGYSGDYRLVNEPREVSWITGAAHFIPRALFMQLGGYDEGYVRGYFEDVDLCMRLKRDGYRVWYEPRSVITHHAGASAGTKTAAEERAAAWRFKRNSLRFHAKWDNDITPDVNVVHVNY